MDIPDESQQISVFVAQNRFVTILKEVPCAGIATVEILGVPREKLSHNGGNPSLTALEKEMDVLCEAQDYVKLSSFIFGLSDIFLLLVNNLLHIIEAFWEAPAAIVRHQASAMGGAF